MTSLHTKFLKFTFIFSLWICAFFVYGKEVYGPNCPIGFTLLFRKEGPLCYRRKGPELFSEKYRDCAGNLYSSELIHETNFTKPDHAVWTQYKSMYPGGFLYDTSFSKNYGKAISFDLHGVSTSIELLDKDEELCLILDPVSNYTLVNCNKRYYSYCVIRPYKSEESLVGCQELKDSVRFWSPDSTCLTSLIGVGGGAIRATWNQAKELCWKNGASLLHRGWRYSNHPVFRGSFMNHTYPLGIIMSNDLSLLRYDAIQDHSEIPQSEWNFDDTIENSDTLLGGLQNDFWSLVNGSYIFYEVICELHLGVKNVSLHLAIDEDNRMTLTINASLHDDDISCYTDSVKPIITKVSKRRIDSKNIFIISPKQDGYYWCIHTNTRNFKPAVSNKVLFLRAKESLINTYSIKFQLDHYVRLSGKDWEVYLHEVCENKIKEYIFYRTKYEQIFGEMNTNVTEDTLKVFKHSNPSLKGKDKAILNIKLKRLYPDVRKVLVHVELNPDMKPVPPGYWEGLKIFYMKSVYYCRGFDTLPDGVLGETKLSGCHNHTCIGNFNEGVQWVTTARTDCRNSGHRALSIDDVTMVMPTVVITSTQSSNVAKEETSDSSEESDNYTGKLTTRFIPDKSTPEVTTEYTTIAENINNFTTESVFTTDLTFPDTTVTTTTYSPTTSFTTTEEASTIPPEILLDRVLEDLDNLVNNTEPVMVKDIDNVFNKIDNILESRGSLEIPSQFLHLLDTLGTTVNLNGSQTATAVRNNIALVLADAEPSHPVRGMKIAARDSDIFTDDAFQIFNGDLNSSDLETGRNEVVVHLPSSLSETSRRVSFVVFRNDRAFTSNSNIYSVNSRVLSVKIENVTTFENNEVIDIHVSPITIDLNRNETRACAYWQFTGNGTGYWSQDGCKLIPATQPGMLSTCRCTHLTHFAEVVFPRTVFSLRDEDMLELLTIIGCCLSIFGLAFVGVTAAMFRSWRRDFSNKIWLQLCIAIFLSVLSFLVVIFAKFQQYNVPCMLMGVVLHYSVLSSFCWMLVAAILSYRRLVLVFTRDASHKLLRASAFAWGTPCAIIGILLSVSPQSYSNRFEEISPSGSFCYPSGLALWISVYAPIALILVINWILFALIVRSVFASRGIQRHGDSNEALRCASVSCLLVFLFGLPWIFGLFAFNVVFAYLFTLTATYQGLILFLFFVVGNKKTRDLWLNKLKIKQTRKVPVTSSTYSNRSSGWRGGTHPMSIESKTSKPKSLEQDDSRFS
ncbi:unnamed protein product [Danaus chrysippus]|uniref:(African queen) hypothetical protein n=1 Tax=Danaus chrysippus TaxID=151541 RepID=A0A8J2R933_9NEOP|nr:unnamed protein product [Danaus chrysippus]